MPGFLASIRALFVGQDDAPAAPRRVGTGGRLDTSAAPVPADSQELVSMARDFRTFLDLQEQRQQELARVVATLPQSMGALPELVRQQTRLADLVAQQLDLNHEGAMKVADGVTTLAGAVVQLQETSDRGSVALQRILERTADRDAGVQKLHATLQNWMLFVAILSCMTLVGAVILAWIVLHAPVREGVAATASAATAEAGSPGATAAAVDALAADLPEAPPPTGSTMPALGGTPEPASGEALPATRGAAPR
ncbi:MAG: hypothetical protein ACKOEP_10275 [Phycisphaerales bacterium]